MEPVEMELIMRDSTREGMESAAIGVDKTNKKMQDAQSRIDSYTAKIEELNICLQEMRTLQQHSSDAIDNSRNTAEIEKLQSRIETLTQSLGKAKNQLAQLSDASYQTKVLPNDMLHARSQFNGLNMSIQQIAREMPTLAMGPQMFFLAISNNLPIFTDQLAIARKEYQALVASGKSATPVWKQVLSSMFSWQTALTTGIMLLVMYGKEIGTWVTGLFHAKTAEDQLREAEEKRFEMEKDARAESYKTRTELMLSIQALETFKGSKRDEKRLLDEMNGKYGETFGYYSTNAEWLDVLTAKTKEYTQLMFLQAKQQALLKKGTEVNEQIEELKQSNPQDASTSMSWWGRAGVRVSHAWKTQGKWGGVAKLGYDLISGKENSDASDEIVQKNYLAYSNKMKELNDQLKKYQDDMEKGISEINNLQSSLYTGGDKPKDKKVSTSTGDSLGDMQLEAQKKLEEQRVALMENGAAKRKAQVELEYRESMARIDKEEKTLMDKYAEVQKSGVKVDPKTIKDTLLAFTDQRINSQQIMETKIAGIEEDARKDARKKRDDEFKSILKDVETYSQARLRIKQEYDAKLALMYNTDDKGNRTTLKEGYTQGNVEMLNTNTEEALTAVDQQFASKQAAYQAWMNSLTDMTLVQLRLVLAQAQKELDNAAPNDEKAQAFARGKIATVTKKIEKVQIDDKLSPGKRTLKQWQALESVLNDANSSFKEIGDSIGGAAGEAISAAGQITAATLQMVGGILQFATTGIDGIKSASTATATAIKTVEAASVILAVISAAIQVATKIASLFTKNKELSQQTIDSYKSYMQVTDDLIKQQKELMEAIAGTQAVMANEKAVSVVENQANAARRMGLAYLNSQKSGHKSYGVQNEKRLKNYADQLNAAGFNWRAMWGTGRMEGIFSMSSSELKRLRDEYVEIWAQIDNQTQEYINTIIECDTKIGELSDTLKESLTGVDFDTLSKNLEDFLNDVDSTFENVAENFETTMTQAINRVIATNLNGDLKSWYANFANAMKDGTLSDTEREALKREYENAYKKAITDRDNAYKAAGIDTKTIQQQTADKGAFETMTQDQGTKLEGLFTALQMIESDSSSYLSDITGQCDQMLDYMFRSFDKLAEIADNTSFCRFIADIKNYMAKIDRDGLKIQ